MTRLAYSRFRVDALKPRCRRHRSVTSELGWNTIREISLLTFLWSHSRRPHLTVWCDWNKQGWFFQLKVRSMSGKYVEYGNWFLVDSIWRDYLSDFIDIRQDHVTDVSEHRKLINPVSLCKRNFPNNQETLPSGKYNARGVFLGHKPVEEAMGFPISWF